MRDEGKEPFTLWLATAEKRRLEDLARQRHCTPADLVQQALAIVYAPSCTVTDTEQVRTVSATVSDTTSATVTATVTDTLRQEFPMLVRAIVQELRTQSALPVTDTVTDTDHGTVTDTVADTKISSLSHAGNANITATVSATNNNAGTPVVTDTVTDTNSHVTATVADTDSTDVSVTIAATMTPPPFDPVKYRLGKLCKDGRDYHHTGKSLRTNNKAGYCLACNAAAKQREREQKRQEVSA
jgi:hypothetical protein